MSLVIREQSEFRKAELSLAKRRVLLKRFLAKNNIQFHSEDPTGILVLLVKQTQRNRLGKPFMTNEEMEKLASEHYLVNNLLAMKQIWGIKAKIGVIDFNGTFKRYGTFLELFKDGHIPKKFTKLDQHLQNLKFL